MAISLSHGPKTTQTAKHNGKALVLVRMMVQGNAAKSCTECAVCADFVSERYGLRNNASTAARSQILTALAPGSG